MQASLIVTSLLPFLAAAAPAQSKTGSPPFALISARSASPVHLLPFTAARGCIYLDGTARRLPRRPAQIQHHSFQGLQWRC